MTRHKSDSQSKRSKEPLGTNDAFFKTRVDLQQAESTLGEKISDNLWGHSSTDVELISAKPKGLIIVPSICIPPRASGGLLSRTLSTLSAIECRATVLNDDRFPAIARWLRARKPLLKTCKSCCKDCIKNRSRKPGCTTMRCNSPRPAGPQNHHKPTQTQTSKMEGPHTSTGGTKPITGENPAE